MTDVEEYDPVTCITAGEIRSLGIAVDSKVPDCGWVPRGSLSMKTAPAVSADFSKLTFDVEVRFNAVFRWIETSVVIKKDNT